MTTDDDWDERIHGFLKPEEDKPEHFAAVGRLITAFNGIDAILNMILRAEVGAETDVGRAIIGGMRTGDMLSALKRIARVKDMPEAAYKELESLAQDIEALKAIRDDVAHKVWAVKGREMAFSNYYVSRIAVDSEIFVYSIELIDDLARYAPYLSERALRMFPKVQLASDAKLPSRDRLDLQQIRRSSRL